MLGLRNLGLPCSGAISPGSNARRTSCGTVCRLWDQGMRNGTGALLVSADTSTGSCKRGASLHSDPSRWETGQVKLLRRPMDRHFHHQKHIYSFSASCPKKKTQKRKYTSNLFAASSRDNAASTLWRDEREMRSSTGSPHHIINSERRRRVDKTPEFLADYRPGGYDVHVRADFSDRPDTLHAPYRSSGARDSEHARCRPRRGSQRNGHEGQVPELVPQALPLDRVDRCCQFLPHLRGKHGVCSIPLYRFCRHGRHFYNALGSRHARRCQRHH